MCATVHDTLSVKKHTHTRKTCVYSITRVFELTAHNQLRTHTHTLSLSLSLSLSFSPTLDIHVFAPQEHGAVEIIKVTGKEQQKRKMALSISQFSVKNESLFYEKVSVCLWACKI